MAKYNQSGDIIGIARVMGNEIDKIPAGCYTVEQDPRTEEFYLQKTTPFAMPSCVYGAASKRAEKVLNTFNDRVGKNTGVLLSGTKGSGKTQLAKDVSNKLLEEGVPTILVQNAYTDGDFINFIKAIEDKALIMFDEFEKVYVERHEQESILTLLDGTGSYNKLYVLTTNNRNVSEFLRNRPSRIYYHFEYAKIPKETMLDLIDDKLKNKSEDNLKNFNILWDVADTLSFDVVQCLIEELNRYEGQSFVETFKELNVEVDTRHSSCYWIPKFLTVNGIQMKIDEENEIHTSSYDFMGGFGELRTFFTLEEGILVDVMEKAGARLYDTHESEVEFYDCDDYCDDEDPSPVIDKRREAPAALKEVEYLLDFKFDRKDTRVTHNSIKIQRVVNGVTLSAEFTRGEEPDTIAAIFAGK